MIEAALPRIPDVSTTRESSELRGVATGIARLGLACVSLAVALDGHKRLPGFAVVNALSVALPIGVGGYVWHRRPAKRLGSLLAMLGVGFFLVALSASRNQVVYSVGRVASFVVAALVVYVILAFPSGRLESRGARFIAGAAVLLVCLLYLPSLPLARSFPHPRPWRGRHAGCPHNAFFAGHQPGFVSVVVPLRELLACVVIAAAVVLVALRIRGASRLGRRMLVPVLAVSTVWMLGLI